MNKIGGSNRVREELTAALADGRGVTAKVRWVSRQGEEGRNKWIHCTPLLGINGQIGVWMVVIVDDERHRLQRERERLMGRQAPPVAADPRRTATPNTERHEARLQETTLANRRTPSESVPAAHRYGYVAGDRPAMPADKVPGKKSGEPAEGEGSVQSFKI